MTTPGELAAVLERSDLPPGEGERFAGYGVMAQPFRSGHILALRRFPRTSIGAGYTSVWQCDPDGRWTMWSDVPCLNSCPRYFGPALAAAEEAAIDIEWPDPWSIRVRINGILDWRTAIGPTPATRLMTTLGSHLPGPLWRNRVILAAMGRVAGPVLRPAPSGSRAMSPAVSSSGSRSPESGRPPTSASRCMAKTWAQRDRPITSAGSAASPCPTAGCSRSAQRHSKPTGPSVTFKRFPRQLHPGVSSVPVGGADPSATLSPNRDWGVRLGHEAGHGEPELSRDQTNI